MTSTYFFSHVRMIVRRSCHLVLLLSLVFAAATPASKLVAATETDEVSSTKRAVTVSGTVFDAESGETLVGVNIMVKGKVVGTSTDANGRFDLTINDDPPFTLVVSIVGFQTQEIEITGSVDDLRIDMKPQAVFGSDVVVSASRVEQGILKAPVSIEKLDILSIRETASTSFYDALSNLKGVDFSTQSLTFRSVNTRGFNSNGNVRFVQLIDGIDNQAPGLNFSVGNIVGITELDLETAELIPGAASALYGPNALNGILLMNSKSPFDYQGLSFSIQNGLNHIESTIEADPALFQKYSFRYAKSWNDRLAIKVTGSFLEAQDFVGEDYRDQSGLVERGGLTRETSANPRTYNGVNVYGDFLITVGTIADIGIAAGGATGATLAAIRNLLPDGAAGAFTPRGFKESDFVDNTTNSTKLGAALHYRLTDRLEVVGQFNTGYGSTVYTANDRFILDNFNIWTAKFELRHPTYFIRAYTTQENTGDTYAANTVASLINQSTYLSPYLNAFASARTSGADVDAAHAIARQYANSQQPQPGSPQFKELYDRFRSIPISEGGAKFLDNSAMYHLEGLYNFAEVIDPEKIELIGGLNVRQFALNSQGTLFALQDNGDEFSINEWGAYLQGSKSFAEGALTFTGSLRYDKNEYFDGQFSPRASVVATIADAHNLRFSYQTGFGIPTTQDQFIDLDVVSRRLVGSNPVLIDRYNFKTNTVYTLESVQAAQAAYLGGASASQAASSLVPFQFGDFQPEQIKSYEVGYKTLVGNKLFIDAYYYFSQYSNYIAGVEFVQGVPNGLRTAPGAGYDVNSSSWKQAIVTGVDPTTGGSFATQNYGFDINADGVVESHGWAVSADYSLPKGFQIGGNVAFNELITQQDLIDQGFRAGYNSPKWRYNVRFQNRSLTPDLGFNVVWRWQDAYLWESSFGNGIIPEYGTLDAQFSYKLSNLNTILKVGGTNVLNERYTSSFGNPLMGAMYYVSLSFDQLLN
ncbi:MAG: TonB-dependent receptor [Bacteroidetes bacterium]|nr:TonB-dependent receptor [Bacteroidota bacterium]